MNLIEQLKRHEGFKGDYYYCTANKKTIGYGRNVENNPFTIVELAMLGRCEFDVNRMTEEEAEMLLVNDVYSAQEKVKSLFSNWDQLNNPRQAVLTNMAFNLGFYGFSKFKNMIAAVNDAYFEKAAREMLSSKWAKQVSGRARQLAEQMATGDWK